MLTTSSHFSWKSGVSLGQFAWRIYPETFSTECSNRSWGFQQGLGTICCHGWSTLSYQRAKHKVNFYTHACNTTQHSQPILPIICISCYVCITTSSKQQHVPAYTVPPSSFLPSNVDFFFVQRTTNPPQKKKQQLHPTQNKEQQQANHYPYIKCVCCVYMWRITRFMRAEWITQLMHWYWFLCSCIYATSMKDGGVVAIWCNKRCISNWLGRRSAGNGIKNAESTWWHGDMQL